jgi:hypothetical protein
MPTSNAVAATIRACGIAGQPLKSISAIRSLRMLSDIGRKAWHAGQPCGRVDHHGHQKGCERQWPIAASREYNEG